MTIIARLPTWRPSAAACLHPPLPRLLCRQLAQGKQVKNTSKQVFSNCTAVPEWISYFHNLIVSFKLIQRMICFSNPPCTDLTLASSSSFFSSLPSFLFFRSIFFFTTNPKPIPSSSLASSPPPLADSFSFFWTRTWWTWWSTGPLLGPTCQVHLV